MQRISQSQTFCSCSISTLGYTNPYEFATEILSDEPSRVVAVRDAMLKPRIGDNIECIFVCKPLQGWCADKG